ncbi:MAG: hypothetical protein IJI37_04950, partial [Opitutales bacterium]|nr:hypothetical protein [Opitutales bacterium]
MKRILVIALSAACIAAGFVMREKNIGHRMPHADEAEQATTASALIDTGVYKYNPNGPHGPTLYYWAAETLGVQPADAQISDFRKTLDPIAAALLILLVLTGRYLGRTAAWAGAACLAMSAFFQIYSGYFVHEIIFAALVYALALAAWQFACSPNVWLALLAGILLGFSQATKETAVISYAAMAGSFAVC